MKHITGNWTYTIGGIPSCPICGKRDKIIGIDGAYECGRCDISPTKYVANMQSRIEELEAMHDHQHLLNLADEAVATKMRVIELERYLKGYNINAYVCKCGHVWLDVNELAAQCCPHCGEVIVFSVGELMTENERLRELVVSLAEHMEESGQDLVNAAQKPLYWYKAQEEK